MYKYSLPGININSEIELPSYGDFRVSDFDKNKTAIALSVSCEYPDSPDEFCSIHNFIKIADTESGWFYASPFDSTPCFLTCNSDYTVLCGYLPECENKKLQKERFEQLLRTAFECRSIFDGFISLHSSCIFLENEAIAFTAASGMGKSTRAAAWIKAFGAEFVSGDRPEIGVGGAITANGAPWDGKENIFKSCSAPLKCILEIRRSNETHIRRLDAKQKLNLISGQTFIPIWDPDAAATAVFLIKKLTEKAEIYRLFCGPDETDAEKAYDIIYNHPEKIQEVQTDMKVKNDFSLRHIAGEYMIMPTGKNTGKYNSTIILNEVSAFIWDQLQNPVSREDLISKILEEYDVSAEKASTDLDSLLEKLRSYDLIEGA